MKRFRKILVWVADSSDGRDCLDQAVAVARDSGATLTLVHAIEPPQRMFRAIYSHVDELHQLLRREWTDRLESLVAPLRREGLDVRSRLLEGKPFIALTREVLRGGHDLLVKPAAIEPDGLLFGSTDMHLLRKCPCAVWITHEAPSSGNILALVDPEPTDVEINRRILQMAASLAESRGTSLDILHVWQASGEQLLSSRIDAAELQAYVRETRTRVAGELQQLIDGLGLALPEERVRLVKGDVRSVVPEFVKHFDVGLIVMGTACRDGIQGLLIGNTAEAILARVRCPVLTVKHHGFISPIQLRQKQGGAARRTTTTV